MPSKPGLPDPLEEAEDRIRAAKFCRDAGDPNWAFGLVLAISDLARCVGDHWQWTEKGLPKEPPVADGRLEEH